MPFEYSKHLDPKLKEKINNLKRYLEPDHPTQDARYLKERYTDAQNQARRDVLRAFNQIFEQEEREIHAYPESVCNVYSVLGLARTHAPSALKNMESGS